MNANCAVAPASPDLSDLARLCKSTGDPLRLEILRVLQQESLGVLELCELFAVKQPAMSHHLKVLASSGAVSTRREGNSIFYRRSLSDIHTADGALLHSLYRSIDQIPLPALLAQRLQDIKVERGNQAREFFDRHAERFQQQQELIAPFDQYAGSVATILRQLPLSATATALEVGPGTGEFLPTLAARFQQVTAIDISREMLEQAEHLRQQQQLENVALLQADTAMALSQGLNADCIVCNMVLHHVPSPADVFRDCARLLLPGGSLIITDLCHHDQDWAHTACGDRWLGFEPEELSRWAASAGLDEADSLYLGLRNGFQIQIRRFELCRPTSTADTQG